MLLRHFRWLCEVCSTKKVLSQPRLEPNVHICCLYCCSCARDLHYLLQRGSTTSRSRLHPYLIWEMIFVMFNHSHGRIPLSCFGCICVTNTVRQAQTSVPAAAHSPVPTVPQLCTVSSNNRFTHVRVCANSPSASLFLGTCAHFADFFPISL